MHNCVVLIGRLTEEPNIKKVDDSSMSTINLAVKREYKNEDGLYETDFIRCVLFNNIAENLTQYCHSGDLVSVKGRLQNRSYETEEKEKKYITEVLVDRVCFLSSKNQ